MRLSVVFALAFAMTVLGQTSSSEPDVITTTDEPEPAPESTPEPSSPPATETEFSITSAPEPTTMSTTTFPVASTAAPASGGGPTCVQRCLAQSATSVGCSSATDLACLCKSQTYLSLARTCFTDSGCEEAISQTAVQDYGRVCSATSTPTTWSTATPSSRTRTSIANVQSATSFTTRTIAFTSGAVVSISRGVSSTITSGFTTIRTEQAGDFGGGGGLAPTSGSDSGSANNGALGMNVGHLTSAGMMMGLGVIGGIAVLIF
ncbi:CFEM domain protein [Rhizoctonia solani 123E]|uniref:CFEM domain protein n=1 Tax=Rhizoctonia solani 123E TaxID=1423351 RepID=A0A074RQL9_9AGAM|nr:CFEM domain protein [Rhizoctonia solani 123E]